MENQIYIYHHLGLGDHFHCNGVVRYLLNNKFNDKKVNLFAKKKYFEMIKFMYRDLKRLEIIPITNNENDEFNDVSSYIKSGDHIEKIGFDYFLKNIDKNKTIDILFYEQLNIDYSKRFELTYWKRDHEKEEELYNKIIQNDKYVFVHDDPSRNFIISDEYIPKDFQIIRNSYEHSIFDYSKIIENAKEIHVMESSARCMLEYLNTENSKHFLYNFIGGPWKSIPFYNDNNQMIGSSKKWEIKEVKFNKKKKFFERFFKF